MKVVQQSEHSFRTTPIRVDGRRAELGDYSADLRELIVK
jgi:hypothetical protein